MTPELPAMNVLGVMSGTSLDGVDAVLVRLEHRTHLQDAHLHGGHLRWRVLERLSRPYPTELRERLNRAIRPGGADVIELTQLHAEVGQRYAEVVAGVAARVAAGIDLVALSGQTVHHIPHPDAARGWRAVSTLQLGEAAWVVERCGVPVVSDFRQADLAAGGGGAPLVSFGDLMLFGTPGKARAVHNLGGISNLTYLPADLDPHGVIAFDTGPANCLIDEAAQRYFGLECDEGGKLAARGRVNEEVLAELLQHPYFALEPPKTTGRETFALAELPRFTAWGANAPEDALATLTALTAASVARAYRDVVPPVSEVLVAGGGAQNPTLLTMLRERLDVPVTTFEEQGWHAKDREALAFAVMGYFAYHGLPNTLPSATGARHPVVAGKLSRPYQPDQP